MASLVSCFECGKSISSEAYTCPHCKESKPHGVACKCCTKKLKRSSAIHISNFDFLHQNCLDQIRDSFQESDPKRYSCPACEKQYQKDYDYTKGVSDVKNFQHFRAKKYQNGSSWSSNQAPFNITCEQCGHRIYVATSTEEYPYDDCAFCGLMLRKIHSVKLEKYGKDHHMANFYAHKICITYHQSEISKISSESSKNQYRKEKEEFWSRRDGDMGPGCLTIFSFVLGIPCTLSGVGWGIVFGWFLIIGGIVTLLDMIKYSR